jgi:hypothetical protein
MVKFVAPKHCTRGAQQGMGGTGRNDALESAAAVRRQSGIALPAAEVPPWTTKPLCTRKTAPRTPIDSSTCPNRTGSRSAIDCWQKKRCRNRECLDAAQDFEDADMAESGRIPAVHVVTHPAYQSNS